MDILLEARAPAAEDEVGALFAAVGLSLSL